jgi:DNA-directed RNA polymerase
MVRERLDAEAAKGVENAKLLVGKVSRKVVKQTVSYYS